MVNRVVLFLSWFIMFTVALSHVDVLWNRLCSTREHQDLDDNTQIASRSQAAFLFLMSLSRSMICQCIAQSMRAESYMRGDQGNGILCCYSLSTYHVLRAFYTLAHLILTTIRWVGIIIFILGQRGVLPFRQEETSSQSSSRQCVAELEINFIFRPWYYNASSFVSDLERGADRSFFVFFCLFCWWGSYVRCEGVDVIF